MAENENDIKPDSTTEKTQPEGDEALDLDEDLAAALDDNKDENPAVNVDELIAEQDPEFAAKMNEISTEDFSGVKIDKDSASEEVDDSVEVPSRWKAYWQNIPDEIKTRYFSAMGVLAIAVPIAFFIFKGHLLPHFELPYYVSMEQLTKKVYSYPTDGVQVPLFDDFRTSTHTVQLPKSIINLRSKAGAASYGEFEFSLVLRDEGLSAAIQSKESELLDLMQRVLEQVTWEELQTPIGKEKVKKIIRHRINEYLQGNVVIGVYYRSVLMAK